MIKPSTIQPDIELRDALAGHITVGVAGGGTANVAVYGDWERPTNSLPDDFITIYVNGNPQGVSMDTPFVKGTLMVSLYCKLNDDGSVKRSRIQKILAQFEETIQKYISETYFFEYDSLQFITPTTPNYTSGYSVTILNLRWNTTSNFNK